MKKILAVVLTAVMLLAVLSGCGSTAPQPDDTQQPQPVQASEPDIPYSPGAVLDSTYKSEFLALSFSAPEGWSFADADELGKLMGASGAVTDFEKYGAVYDMSASSKTGGTNVRIGLDCRSDKSGDNAAAEREHAAVLESALQSISAFDIDFTEPATVSVANRDFTFIHSAVGNTGAYQDFLIRCVGDYILCISLTGLGDDSQPLWQYFSAIEQ